MIERLRIFSLPRRHPRPELLSQYLEGELDAHGREALEAHLRHCGRCRRLLDSLTSMVRALGSIGQQAPVGLADRIIATLRTERPESVTSEQSHDAAPPPVLTVVGGSSRLSDGDLVASRSPHRLRAGLRYCLQRPQLRLTVPIALVAGVVLSVVNMGGMLIHGRIDLGVCVSCATDFLVPFVALNLGLLTLLGLPQRNRI